MYRLNRAKYEKINSMEGLPDPKDDFSKYALGLEDWRRKAITVIWCFCCNI